MTVGISLHRSHPLKAAVCMLTWVLCVPVPEAQQKPRKPRRLKNQTRRSTPVRPSFTHTISQSETSARNDACIGLLTKLHTLNNADSGFNLWAINV